MNTAKEILNHLKYKVQQSAANGLSETDAYFAKRSLYKNPTFHLVHAQKNESGAVSLTMVTPAHDQDIRKQVQAEGYYTASHMWGEPELWMSWTSHGIVGPDGQLLSVKMRREKQETFIRLLRDYPGYWWIDVFCARDDTELYMMGDVYRFCRQCFALLDFDERIFQQVNDVNRRLQSLESYTALTEKYKQRIDGKSGSADQSWDETLSDLLGGWYQGSSDDITALAAFFGCKWFTRVWTLQEYLLPSTLTFVSECGTGKTLPRSVIEEITDALGHVVNAALNSYIDKEFGKHPSLGYLGFTKEQHMYAARKPGISSCYFDMSRIVSFEIVALFVYIFRSRHGFNLMDLRHVSFNVDPLVVILVHFARLPRTCMFPCDYVYGVAGLLDIEIPNTLDPSQVWTSFRRIIQKRAPGLKIPEQFDLSKARDMQDVYNIFLGEDITKQVRLIDNIFENAEMEAIYTA